MLLNGVCTWRDTNLVRDGMTPAENIRGTTPNCFAQYENIFYLNMLKLCRKDLDNLSGWSY